MWVEDYQWHYDYIRLAWDTGFMFDKCKSPNLDKNKICVVDIDRIVRERDVASVDRHISTVVQYILDDEQAKVLDHNFVKIFRLSQLAVEFLLFCKRYLDNTVVLLKKELTKAREENKELKSFGDDLQSHLNILTTQQALATFKCSICSKTFASDEFLNAHIKRRHNNESYNVETNQLNLEIKQLKERLNSTEKLLKEKEEQNFDKKLLDPDNSSSKIDELQQKFEQFKRNIDVELKELKMQKSFYEENYGKLFNIMVNSKENMEQKCENIKDISKAEITTQTDKLLHIENVHDRNVLEIQEPCFNSLKTENENNLKETKESLEVKISTTLSGIEDQMQAFWNKLNEIEVTKAAVTFQPDLELGARGEEVITNNFSENYKPQIKPRSKLTQPTHNTRIIGEHAEKLSLAIKQIEQEQNVIQKEIQSKHKKMQVVKDLRSESKNRIPITNILPPTVATKDWSDDAKLDSESYKTSDSESHSSGPKDPVLVKPLASDLERQAISSFSKKSCDREILKNLNKEIQEVVFGRIQELGISKSWFGIPQRSFEKSLEILNHQAVLTKRTYLNFDLLKKKINRDVERRCTRKASRTIQLKPKPERTKMEKPQNIVKISYRSKPDITSTANQRNLTSASKRETIEIKNRALYDTDTESEKNFKTPFTKVIVGTSEPQQMYSDVVKEFKSLSTNKLQKYGDADIDDLNKKEDLQKGVLKSFPSVGSLSKKKVLFDLDEDSSKREDVPVIQRTEGSTTSVASSILEHSIKDSVDLIKYEVNKRNENEEKVDQSIKENDLNNLSDFDFSDL